MLDIFKKHTEFKDLFKPAIDESTFDRRSIATIYTQYSQVNHSSVAEIKNFLVALGKFVDLVKPDNNRLIDTKVDKKFAFGIFDNFIQNKNNMETLRNKSTELSLERKTFSSALDFSNQVIQFNCKDINKADSLALKWFEEYTKPLDNIGCSI